VICPEVSPRVEKPDKLARLPKDRPNVATFPAVTENTGISQVIRFHRTTVLYADNMVNFTSEVRIVFVNQTIFAEIVSAGGNETPEAFANISTHW
jgi:hypothetical protein